MKSSRDMRIDRSTLEITDLSSAGDDTRDLLFWRSQPARERLEGIEFLRQSFYRYDPISERLPRLLETFER
jgi:hypothetical protein